MRYITTDKHPELKEGIRVFKGVSNYRTDFFPQLSNEFNINTWVAQGYIKELQEPEFTKDDMISFAQCLIGTQGSYQFDKWLKQRKG